MASRPGSRASSRQCVRSLNEKAPVPRGRRGRSWFLAEMRANRTHPRRSARLTTALKAAGPTRTHPSPRAKDNVDYNKAKRPKTLQNAKKVASCRKGTVSEGACRKRFLPRLGRGDMCVVAAGGGLVQKSPIIADSRAQRAAVAWTRTFAPNVFPDGEMMGAQFADQGPTMRKKPVISVQKGRWGEALPPSGNPGAQPRDRMRHRCRVGVGRMEAGGRGLTRAWGPARAGRRRGA